MSGARYEVTHETGANQHRPRRRPPRRPMLRQPFSTRRVRPTCRSASSGDDELSGGRVVGQNPGSRPFVAGGVRGGRRLVDPAHQPALEQRICGHGVSDAISGAGDARKHISMSSSPPLQARPAPAAPGDRPRLRVAGCRGRARIEARALRWPPRGIACSTCGEGGSGDSLVLSFTHPSPVRRHARGDVWVKVRSAFFSEALRHSSRKVSRASPRADVLLE